MKVKTGNVDSAKTVRAGCGLRYDPEQLGDDTGFDFSAAKSLSSVVRDEQKDEERTPGCLKRE